MRLEVTGTLITVDIRKIEIIFYHVVSRFFRTQYLLTCYFKANY